MQSIQDKLPAPLQKIITPQWKPGRAALAGIIATLVYSVAMESDQFIIGNRFNDVRFIEALYDGTKRTTPGLILAWIIHLLNGVALAELYAAVVKRFLPGPDWLKGSLFGELFIISAWSLTPIADKYHPLIKNGELPKLLNWTSFGQNNLRHLIFGLVLGLLYKDQK